MNILIIDDHPLNVDSYTALLSTIETIEKPIFYRAYNCKEAFETIQKLSSSNTPIDIAFLDVSLPAYEDQNIYSGEDIGKLLQQQYHNCKIVIISMHSEPVWVNRIIKKLNPNGFLSKNDMDYKGFSKIIKLINNDKNYYSKSIIEAQKEFMFKNLDWDEHDSKILQLIAEGIKTKILPDYIPLSLSSIEKRKANLKKQLLFNGGSDKELIKAAKEMGLFDLPKTR